MPVTPSGGPGGWSIPAGEQGPKRVVIRYEGALAALDASGSPFGGSEPGSGEDGSFLPGGTAWLPMFDDAGLADYRVSVVVPDGYRPVMTGRLEEEAPGRAVFTAEGAVEEPSLFAGRWDVRERMADGLAAADVFRAGSGRAVGRLSSGFGRLYQAVFRADRAVSRSTASRSCRRLCRSGWALKGSHISAGGCCPCPSCAGSRCPMKSCITGGATASLSIMKPATGRKG